MKNKYKINGETTTIFLPRKDGSYLETLIDTEDLEKAMSLDITWYGTYKKNTDSFYVQGHLPGTCQGKLYFHRFIMDAIPGMDIDHINHDTLDNRRSKNLREVTRSENMKNLKRFRGRRKLNREIIQSQRSGIKYVCWEKSSQRWIVKIKKNGKTHNFGRYDNLEDAEKAVDKGKEILGISA